MSKGWKTFAIWCVLLVLFFSFYSLFSRQEATPLASRTAQDFQADADKDEIESMTPDRGSFIVRKHDGEQYRVRAGLDEETWRKLGRHGVQFLPPKSSGSSGWTSFLVSWLPLLVLVVFFVFLLRRMGGNQNFFALRKTTARLVSKPPGVTFADVGGAAEAKQRLRDMVDFLRRPRAWEAAGARLPHGVLLEGPPGSGKTLLARALAGEAKVPFFEVSASEFVEMFVGVGSARVRDLFEQAGKKTPAVIFIDELDAVGRRRGAGSALSPGHQEREQTLNQLLVCLDGFQKRRGVVVLAATNRADILDAALLRPGRFDVRLRMPPLTEQTRLEVLQIHLKGKPVSKALDVSAVARQTEGHTGAELERLVNEAAIHAVRRSNGTPATLDDEDFQSALAAESNRKNGFNQLDAMLIESGSQLVQPHGRVVLRATLKDGSAVSGELVWADERFLKLKGAEGGLAALSKQSIVRVEALEGTAPASLDEIHEGTFGRIVPGGV